MEKFDIIPGRDPHTALTDVAHNESPRCRLLVSDLNINDVYEGESLLPVQIFDYTDPHDGFYYWAEITLVERFESGDFNHVMEDCWKWWLANEIAKREMQNLSDD